MPPKVEGKREVVSLTAVVVVDSFDQRFYPFTQTLGPWCLQPLCNVPIIDYTLSWILRTEVKKVILVVTEKHADYLVDVEKAWKTSFEDFTIVSCNAMSVGDSLRELDGRGLLTGDFILLSNPATITSSTLDQQIAKFRERRRADKNNVMTLVYSQLENTKNTVVAVEKSTNKLRLYHKEEDSTQLDVDMPNFLENAVIRRDIVDSGIAICSLNIAAQFTDNFDFQKRDDVIREILVNEEILLQNIHIEVLPETEAAVTVTDYESLLLASSLLMERWLYPIVPDKMVIGRSYGCHAKAGNVYNGVDSKYVGRLSPQTGVTMNAFNVAVGLDVTIDDSVEMANVTVGNKTTIGANSVLSNCIVGDGCMIGENCRITDAVIGNGVTISDGTVLESQAVIAADVHYPSDLEYPVGSAVSSREPDDDDETINHSTKNGLTVWSLASGSTFWRCPGANDAPVIVVGEDIEMGSGPESGSDDDESVEWDAAGQFLREVADVMASIQQLEFKPEHMNSLILEINSSKLANNVTMEDVAKNVFYAFMSLPGNETLAGIKTMIGKWNALFKNYYQPRKSQVQILMAIEEKYKENAAGVGPMVAKLVHTLYNDLDILEEEAILEWADSLEDDAALAKLIKPIVDWLREDEDDDSSEEED